MIFYLSLVGIFNYYWNYLKCRKQTSIGSSLKWLSLISRDRTQLQNKVAKWILKSKWLHVSFNCKIDNTITKFWCRRGRRFNWRNRRLQLQRSFRTIRGNWWHLKWERREEWRSRWLEWLWSFSLGNLKKDETSCWWWWKCSF